MRVSTIAIAACLLLACGSTGSTPVPDGGSLANPDAGADAGDGGLCCPPDPSPGCCMRYGGWSDTGQCFQVCDGMPQPGDPEWTLATDAHGCSVWTNPKPNGGAGTCGAATPPPDAGGD